MVERNEFDIELVPATYKEAMQNPDSTHWVETIKIELASMSLA
jgi:hypothetical protein